MGKGKHTKEFIIERAAELFNTKGYAGSSLSDLMTATGLKKGGIYNHFSNKDEISLAAFAFAISKLEDRLMQLMRPAKTEHARLIAILDFYRQYAIRPVITGGCPILNTIVDANHTHPALIALARRKTKRLIKGLERIIERGQRKGEFNKTPSPHTVALTLFSGIEGALLLTKVYQNNLPIEAAIDCLKSYLNDTVAV